MAKKKRQNSNYIRPQAEETFTPEPLGAKVSGIIGAVSGATFGCIPYLIATMMGVFSAPLALLVPVFSQMLYRRTQGYRRYSYALKTLIFTTIFIVLSMGLTGQAIRLALEPSWKAAAAENGISLFVLVWDSILAAENLKVLAPGLVMSLLFGFLGVTLVDKYLKSYASLSKEDEQKILAWEKGQQQAIEEKEAALRAKKEENKEKRAVHLKNLDGSDRTTEPEAPQNYTVAPYQMQKQSLHAAAAGFGLAAIALGAFGLYKVMGGSLKFLLLLAAAALFAYQALKTFKSAQRGIDVDGDLLVYTPAFGKAEEFTFAQIRSCSKRGNQVTLKGAGDQFLGFFSMTWENSNDLLKAIRKNRISVTEA